MIDLQSAHNAMQYPAFVALTVMAYFLAMRAWQIYCGSPEISEWRSVAAYAVAMVALTIKQGFWFLQWTLRSADIPELPLDIFLAVPLALNATVALAGTVVCALAARRLLGRMAAPSALAGLIGIYAIGQMIISYG